MAYSFGPSTVAPSAFGGASVAASQPSSNAQTVAGPELEEIQAEVS